MEQGTWPWQFKFKGENRDLWPSKSPQTGHPYEKSKDWRQGTSFGSLLAEVSHDAAKMTERREKLLSDKNKFLF